MIKGGEDSSVEEPGKDIAIIGARRGKNIGKRRRFDNLQECEL